MGKKEEFFKVRSGEYVIVIKDLDWLVDRITHTHTHTLSHSPPPPPPSPLCVCVCVLVWLHSFSLIPSARFVDVLMLLGLAYNK